VLGSAGGLGFADVLALMATAVWLAIRHQRRNRAQVADDQHAPRPTSRVNP
jgi:hypothetical protein